MSMNTSLYTQAGQGHAYLTREFVAQWQREARQIFGLPDPDALAQWVLNAADEASVLLETDFPSHVLILPGADAHAAKIEAAREFLEDFRTTPRIVVIDVQQQDPHADLIQSLSDLIEGDSAATVVVLGPPSHLPSHLADQITWLNGFVP